jgi:serine protease AprX
MCAAALLTVAVSLSLALTTAGVPASPGNGHPAAATIDGGASPVLAKLAAAQPAKQVEAIVQFKTGVEPAEARGLVRSAGGRVTGDLHVINGLAAHMTAAQANRLASREDVRAVSLNRGVRKNSIDAGQLATSYNQSLTSDQVWGDYGTGRGVGVAVIDTGIAESMTDFEVDSKNDSSRVVATAVTNPEAKSDTDKYGHGTHVAGIIGGNGNNRSKSDSLHGKYVGVAPEADLISVKVDDDEGQATIVDVIYGLQFVVDHKEKYNIRVVNLSLESSVAESYKTDPLDAAAEAAWFNGIVVVAAAGNRGTDPNAVSYAPGNDPFVISVGAVDDQGTSDLADDKLASWSSRGETQDGFSKPDVLAPGSGIVSTLAPNSEFASMCPTCIRDGEYIRAGGTSMSAPMVSGLVAIMLEDRPTLTPDRVKGILMSSDRNVPGVGDEAYAVGAVTSTSTYNPNEGIAPNKFVKKAANGKVDFNRSSWSRSSWSRSSWSRSSWSRSSWSRSSWSRSSWSRSSWSRSSWSRSSWSRSSWSCDCSRTADGSIDPARSSWSRSSWSTSWNK